MQKHTDDMGELSFSQEWTRNITVVSKSSSFGVSAGTNGAAIGVSKSSTNAAQSEVRNTYASARHAARTKHQAQAQVAMFSGAGAAAATALGDPSVGANVGVTIKGPPKMMRLKTGDGSSGKEDQGKDSPSKEGEKEGKEGEAEEGKEGKE